MTDFNESKLSRIIARRIIAPEDRSQMLPLCTPIYCPTYNGVRASRVTVINPNTNSFNDLANSDVTAIGSTITKATAAINPLIEKNGTLTVNNSTGIVTGFSSANYLGIEGPASYDMDFIHMVGILPSKIENPINIVASTSDVIETITVQPNGNITLEKGNAEASILGKASFGKEFVIELSLHDKQINVTLKHITESNGDLKETLLPTGTVSLLSFGASSDSTYSVDLEQSYFTLGTTTKVPMFNLGRNVTKGTSNTFDISMTIPVSHTYFVPHEVDLETDVNLLDMIKSDFAVRFKKAVSNEILNQITTQKASISKITAVAGDTVAKTIGSVIASITLDGTGQKYSIYKYDNGAPVSYIKSSNQPNIDDLVLDNEKPDALLSEIPQGAYKREYAVKDDVDVPALYYIEEPTVILNPTLFTEYQQGLCSGGVRDYANKTLSVQGTKVDISDVGDGVAGTNDTFAVAFTDASIKFSPDKDFFAQNISITVYFGVKLVHTNNLRIIN